MKHSYGQQRRFPLTKGIYRSNQVVHGKRLLSRYDLREQHTGDLPGPQESMERQPAPRVFTPPPRPVEPGNPRTDHCFV